MEGIVDRSFKLNLILLRVLGLYPSKKPLPLYLLYGYLLLVCCLLPDPILSLLYYVKDEELSIMDAGFNLFLMVAMISFVPKMLPFIRNHREIKKCIYWLQLMNINPNVKQKQIIDDCVWVCRRNTNFFLFCTIFDFVSWSTRPLFFSKWDFPMTIWLPFDPTNNTVVFVIIYMFVSTGALYSTLISVAVDPLIAGLAYHAAGQIKILKDNLNFMSEYAEEEIKKSVINPNIGCVYIKFQIIYQEIRKCIRHHHNILNFVRDIEKCFSWIVFSQFLGSTIIICFCCLQLSRLEPGSTSFFLMIVYFLSALMQIYFYCYYGTTLYEESATLTRAAYLGQWYEYDMMSKKALIILMQQANVSITITSGKLLDLSLPTFTQLIKKSYSLLAVLKKY